MRGLTFQRFIFILVSSVVLINCGQHNFLEEFGKKDTNEALFYEAKLSIDAGNYSDAISAFESMTSDYKSQRDIAIWHASAYAGRCGLDYLALLKSLDDIGTDTLFTFLMKSYSGGTSTNIDDCESAEAIIKGIGDAAARTTDENMLMIFLSFAKVGQILSVHGDTDNNDTADSTFNACDATDISDDQVTGVGTGVANMMTSLSAISGDSTVGSDQLTSAEGACSDMETEMGGVYAFCNNTNKSDFDTAEEIKGVRTLIKEDSAIGLGADCNGDVSACKCP